MKAIESIRQGDVLLVYVDSIPTSAEDCDDANGLAVLAYGEVSGHAHLVERKAPGSLRYVKTRAGERFLSLLGQALIKHGNLTPTGITDGTADHSALLLREGKLQQAFQVEDWGDEIRNVAD